MKKQEYGYSKNTEFLQVKTNKGWQAVGCMNWETQCQIRCAALELDEDSVFLHCCNRQIKNVQIITKE